MDHDVHHHRPVKTNKKEYLKFALVLCSIVVLSYLHARWRGISSMQFLASFMGVFFVVFASFKLVSLREFAHGFTSYDLVAQKSIAYAYAYPFIQFLLGIAYLLGTRSIFLDLGVLIISLVSAYGVYRTIRLNKQFHCACLGSFIKLPLSSISLVEDAGMAVMAILMLTLHS